MKRSCFPRRLVCLVLLALAPAVAQQPPDAVSRAMKDELARSIEKLRLAGLDKPYFIAYRVDESNSTQVSASLGALTASSRSRQRRLSVDMHVGDYALDNTNFLAVESMGAGMFASASGLPLDDDYDQLRRALWLTTDRAYKRAAKELSAKRSVLEHRQGTAAVPDLLQEPAVVMERPKADIKVDLPALEDVARKLSAVFRDHPEVIASGVTIAVRDGYVRYLNTEGTRFSRPEPFVLLHVFAQVRAEDGIPLLDGFQVYSDSTGALLDASLLERTRGLLSHLEALRHAPVLDSYDGPVLFEGDAAGEALSQVLAPALAAARFPLTDQPQFEAQMQQMMGQFGGTPLENKIGARVLPAAFDLADQPHAADYHGTRLLGARDIDDDGVPTRDLTLIDHGILKAVLSTRVPTAQTKASTGSRRAFGPSPSNLFLTARDAMPAAQLKAELLRLAKERNLEYAIVIRRVGPAGLSWITRMAGMQSGNGAVPTATGIYRVYPDGREELVREAEIEPMTAATFKDLVAADDHPVVYHGIYIPLASSIFGAFGGGGVRQTSPGVVSYVTPSLLFEDVSLKKTGVPAPNPPVVPSPMAASPGK